MNSGKYTAGTLLKVRFHLLEPHFQQGINVNSLLSATGSYWLNDLFFCPVKIFDFLAVHAVYCDMVYSMPTPTPARGLSMSHQYEFIIIIKITIGRKKSFLTWSATGCF